MRNDALGRMINGMAKGLDSTGKTLLTQAIVRVLEAKLERTEDQEPPAQEAEEGPSGITISTTDEGLGIEIPPPSIVKYELFGKSTDLVFKLI